VHINYSLLSIKFRDSLNNSAYINVKLIWGKGVLDVFSEDSLGTSWTVVEHISTELCQYLQGRFTVSTNRTQIVSAELTNRKLVQTVT
jgi:hypothetical protein